MTKPNSRRFDAPTPLTSDELDDVRGGLSFSTWDVSLDTTVYLGREEEDDGGRAG